MDIGREKRKSGQRRNRTEVIPEGTRACGFDENIRLGKDTSSRSVWDEGEDSRAPAGASCDDLRVLFPLCEHAKKACAVPTGFGRPKRTADPRRRCWTERPAN